MSSEASGNTAGASRAKLGCVSAPRARGGWTSSRFQSLCFKGCGWQLRLRVKRLSTKKPEVLAIRLE